MTPPGPTTEHLQEDDAGERLSLRGFRLIVIDGPDAGVVTAARGERIAIGRHQSADLRLTDGSVSLFHCEVEVGTGPATVRDLGSRNGTLIDGVSVREGFPQCGAILTLGRTRIRLEIGSDEVAVPIALNQRFELLVGRSVAMRRMFGLLERAAASDATVLIEGETGTGKEVAAESLHRASPRRDGPFVVVDCGAIPPTLLESELFGHERGAYTGAVGERVGAFEEAIGGTIFLDEIGELGSDLQPKLLRALERKEVKRVGSNRWISVDCRVIAATSRSLRVEVNERRFRSDLYYRLAVVEVRTPSLRERPEDLPVLVEHFLSQVGVRDHGEAARLRTPEQRAHLERHGWPGNVRELRNYVERCVALGELPPLPRDGDDAGPGHGVPRIDTSVPLRTAREHWLEHFERRYLEEVLESCGGNVSAAARRAGMDRPSFYRLLWRTGLR